MACDLPPLPKKRKSPAAAPTTISALGDDLLREIFLRLPSLPALVRAALTCRSSLRAVRSCPTFRRRFRELRSPPLLGLFINILDFKTPAFRPLRLRPDPDIAAVVRRADFFLTRLPNSDEGSALKWLIRDCRDGYVVLISQNTNHMAVYNPLTRALHLLPKPPRKICKEMYVEFHVLSSEEDPGLFRVICVCHEVYGAQAAVISSETREWQIFPWVEAANIEPDLQPEHKDYTAHNGVLVNGHIYWTQASRASARVLNTATLQFSRIDLPPHIRGQGALTAGETRDGKLCVICAIRLTLVVWSWIADDDGIERWMLDKKFQLLPTIHALAADSPVDGHELKILAIVNGVVYLSMFYELEPSLSGWFLSFCLETGKLNKLCHVLHPDSLYPYIMAWPPSLVVLDKVNP
ncbi:hypothetical protein QYE76_012387 [Lolium multiflorum]|uniref:F-box domain-containing protein n=1 Tax=Lolium multiflorum TaxID=4521 RepID=A0AAD8X4X1_LOLMU|nr:hypothetical protein QYE76_012387 [Lolium multiflorum]